MTHVTDDNMFLGWKKKSLVWFENCCVIRQIIYLVRDVRRLLVAA